MDPKAQWRQTILEKRNNLAQDFVKEASRKIALHLFGLEEFNLSERLGLYAAFRNEPETEAIFVKSHALRKEIYYPKVNAEKKEARFFRVNALQELKKGYAGILEPSKSKNHLSNIDYLNTIVIPGVVFDQQGNRIGLGEGYYDKLLENFHGKRIALAYEFQVVDALPQSHKDQRVDIIITEERIIMASF